MQNDLKKQIEDEYARITALDSKLDANRTPAAKEQLRLAKHFLDDAQSSLRDVYEGDASNGGWPNF